MGRGPYCPFRTVGTTSLRAIAPSTSTADGGARILGVDRQEPPLRRLHNRRGPRAPRRRRETERDVVRRGERGFDRAVERFRREVPAPDAGVDRLRLAVTQDLNWARRRDPTLPPRLACVDHDRGRKAPLDVLHLPAPGRRREVEAVVLEQEPDRRKVDAAVRIVRREHCVTPLAEEGPQLVRQLAHRRDPTSESIPRRKADLILFNGLSVY